MKHLGLRAKFLILLGIILLVLFSLLTYTLIQQSTTSLQNNLNEKSKAFATLATKPIADTFLLYKDSGRIRITQQAQKFYELDHDIAGVSVIDSSGVVQYQYKGKQRKTITLPETHTFDPIYSKDASGTITQIIQPYIEDYGGYRYSLVYNISNARITEQVTSMTYLLIGLGLSLGLISLLLLYYVFNIVFIRPVREVSRLASIISAGNLEQQITIDSRDEIGELASAVNTMSNKLKADIVQLMETDRLKNEFIMISSHNLRTPLTVINGYIDMIKSLDIGKDLEEFLAIIDKNTNKLSKLTEDMLTISTVESGGGLVANDSVPLKPILEDIIRDFTPLMKEKGVSFKVTDTLNNEVCNISKSYFKSAIENVLDNALKFSKRDGTVHFSAKTQKQQCIIVVEDNGTGISDAELPLLFTKFHRGTDTLQYEYEGVGLGLYVSKIIIDEFQGSIEVNSKKDKGTTVTITLPLSLEKKPADQ